MFLLVPMLALQEFHLVPMLAQWMWFVRQLMLLEMSQQVALVVLQGSPVVPVMLQLVLVMPVLVLALLVLKLVRQMKQVAAQEWLH